MKRLDVVDNHGDHLISIYVIDNLDIIYAILRNNIRKSLYLWLKYRYVTYFQCVRSVTD